MSLLSKKMSSLGIHRSTSIGIASAAEEHKKRIARAPEEREERRMALNQVHRALIELVLPYFNIDKATAEEFIIDTAQQIKLLQNFVVKNGKKAIMFFYQLDDPISPEGRAPIPQNTKMGGPVQALLGPKGAAACRSAPEKVLRMFVTDGTDEGLRGGFVVLMRENRDMNTIANVLVVAVPTDEGAVLGMMEEQLARILRPSLQSVSKWGELDKSPADQFTVTTFLKRVDLFISILRATVISIENVVKMPEFCSELELEKVKTAQDCMAGAADPDYVKNVEVVILLWCKNIDLILKECEQVRYESGETGPYTELDNWRALNARYNSLIELIRSHNCRMAIQILHIAKSPTLEKWKELNNKLTDVANEAKDNMKYLYTLEKLCEPLYHNDPGLMLDSIPSLINAIRMIQNISRYYNTSDRMTSLFVKETNQMVKTCKNYLSADGTERIYNLPSSVTLKRIDDCIALNNKYRDTFLKTQSNMRDTSEKPFDFSEMYVFGKFEAFCRHLEKIRFILNTIDEYFRMRNCVMEGLEPISHKFQTLFNTTKNSNTDVLDHRNSEFEFEFQEFNSKLTSHQATLDSFMNASIDRTKITLQALHLLSVFESLGIKRLKVQEKYDALFQNYEKDLEDVKNYYIRNYENPALPRNTTPVAGRIMWARNLATRMQAPMKTFSERPDMLTTTRGRAVLKAYNRMNRVLVEFELLYHTAWLKSISAISEALQVPPLVCHPDSRQLYVNLEATVYQVTQEVCYMLNLGLEVPRHALLLVQMKSKLKRRHALLINLLKRDEVVREKIPESLQVMFESSLMRIDYLMRPALTSLTWTSINLDLYFARANGGLDEQELYMDQIFDLKSTRIDRYVDTIGATILFDNDNIDGWTLSEFEVSTERYTRHCQTEMSNMSFKVEEGLKELTVLLTKRAELMLADCASLAIDEEDNSSQQDGERDTGAENLSMLLSRRSKKEEMLMRDKLKETFVVSYNRLVEALARSSKISLDILRKRSSFIPIIHGEISRRPVNSRPFFQTFVILSGVRVTMQPSADELQLGIMRASSLLEVSMGVQLWDQARIMPWVAERENKMAASPVAVATVNERNSTMAAVKKTQSSFSTPHDEDHDHRGTRKSNADLTALDTDAEYDERGERRIQSSFYSGVSGHKDVLKVISELQTAMLTVKPLIAKSLNQFSTYSWIWTSDKKTVIDTFMKTDPIISDFTQELKYYDHLEEEISDLDDHEHVGHLLLNRTNIKNTLKEQEAKLKQLLLKTMNEHYQEILGDIMPFIEEESTKLARPNKDLEDIRVTMLTLENIRAQFVDIDTSVPSVEEAYMLLSKYEYPVPQEESEMADGVRYKFKNLIQSMTQTMDHLLEIQPNYKSELISCIEELTADINSYDIDYQLNGPMVEGITPSEASTRLFQFQTRYEQLKRNYVTYTTGEKLFGMPVSEYPLLNQYNKELGMLQKLYGLYNVVIETVNGYYDLLWTEVNIDKINADITDFQNKCKKLPKGMQEWQAFIDLKKTIDDFNETCPVLEMMTQKSMKDRHWERISNLTGHPFEVSSPDCRLRDIMEAPLLQFKDDIELWPGPGLHDIPELRERRSVHEQYNTAWDKINELIQEHDLFNLVLSLSLPSEPRDEWWINQYSEPKPQPIDIQQLTLNVLDLLKKPVSYVGWSRTEQGEQEEGERDEEEGGGEKTGPADPDKDLVAQRTHMETEEADTSGVKTELGKPSNQSGDLHNSVIVSAEKRDDADDDEENRSELDGSIDMEQEMDKIDVVLAKEFSGKLMESDIIKNYNVEAARRRPDTTSFLINKKLRPVIHVRSGMFENVQPIEEKTALQLIILGYKQLSRFGWWCPVKLLEGDWLPPVWDPRVIVTYSAVYRRYIYFFLCKQVRNEFTTDPFKFLQQHSPRPHVSIRIAVVGPPNSGKITVCEGFVRDFGCVRVSVGEALRTFLYTQPDTSLARQIRDVLENGGEVPDVLAVRALQVVLMNPHCHEIGELTLHDSADVFGIKLTGWRSEIVEVRNWYTTEHDNWSVLDVTRSKWWVGNQTRDIYEQAVLPVSTTCIDSIKQGKAVCQTGMCISPLELKARLSEFDQYCPVSLADCKLVDGSHNTSLQYAAEQKGYYYKMPGLELKKFLSTPDKYVPPLAPRSLPPEHMRPKRITAAEVRSMFPAPLQLRGYCPVTFYEGRERYGAIVSGNPELVVQFKNKIYYFETEEKLEMFMRRPHRYSEQKVPHQLPPKREPMTVGNLPTMGYLDQTADDAMKPLLAVSTLKPKFPFISATRHKAFHLKGKRQRQMVHCASIDMEPKTIPMTPPVYTRFNPQNKAWLGAGKAFGVRIVRLECNTAASQMTSLNRGSLLEVHSSGFRMGAKIMITPSTASSFEISMIQVCQSMTMIGEYIENKSQQRHLLSKEFLALVQGRATNILDCCPRNKPYFLPRCEVKRIDAPVRQRKFVTVMGKDQPDCQFLYRCPHLAARHKLEGVARNQSFGCVILIKRLEDGVEIPVYGSWWDVHDKSTITRHGRNRKTVHIVRGALGVPTREMTPNEAEGIISDAQARGGATCNDCIYDVMRPVGGAPRIVERPPVRDLAAEPGYCAATIGHTAQLDREYA